MRIAVLGASGFVGATTAELLTSRGAEVVPVIHSTGNAWRLTRLGIVPKVADFLDRKQAENVLDGCTHVINCMRGDDQAMMVGMEHALHAALRAKVQKFVHLSSVAVYGDPPPAAASSEDAPTNPAKGGYGWVKLAQDQKVQKAAQRGLPSVILCPPNIIGPYSPYLLQLLDTLLKREFALLDDGSAVCCVVDVQNLAHAGIVALDSAVSDGSRFFVTEDDRVSWARLVTSLAAEARVTTPPPSISEAELRRRIPAAHRPRLSITRSMKHLLSSDVRRALRQDPLLERADTFVRGLAAGFGTAAEDRLRRSLAGPQKVAQFRDGDALNVALCAQQLRGVWHSCERAKSAIGYRPPHSFADSMSAFGRWLRETRGMDQPEWPMVQSLFGYTSVNESPARA